MINDLRPATVTDALRTVVDWLDHIDRLAANVAAAKGVPNPIEGQEVQRDMRVLADWFAAHPEAADAAWQHVRQANP